MDDQRDFVRNLPCAACGKPPPSDPAHVKTKGAGATNLEHEMIPLCREHHVIQHKWGWKKFTNCFPAVKSVLKNKGWDFHDNFGIEKLVFTGTSHWERPEDY